MGRRSEENKRSEFWSFRNAMSAEPVSPTLCLSKIFILMWSYMPWHLEATFKGFWGPNPKSDQIYISHLSGKAWLATIGKSFDWKLGNLSRLKQQSNLACPCPGLMFSLLCFIQNIPTNQGTAAKKSVSPFAKENFTAAAVLWSWLHRRISSSLQSFFHFLRASGTIGIMLVVSLCAFLNSTLMVLCFESTPVEPMVIIFF